MKFIHFTDPHLVPRGEVLHGLNPSRAPRGMHRRHQSTITGMPSFAS